MRRVIFNKLERLIILITFLIICNLLIAKLVLAGQWANDYKREVWEKQLTYCDESPGEMVVTDFVESLRALNLTALYDNIVNKTRRRRFYGTMGGSGFSDIYCMEQSEFSKYEAPLIDLVNSLELLEPNMKFVGETLDKFVDLFLHNDLTDDFQPTQDPLDKKIQEIKVFKILDYFINESTVPLRYLEGDDFLKGVFNEAISVGTVQKQNDRYIFQYDKIEQITGKSRDELKNLASSTLSAFSVFQSGYLFLVRTFESSYRSIKNIDQLVEFNKNLNKYKSDWQGFFNTTTKYESDATRFINLILLGKTPGGLNFDQIKPQLENSSKEIIKTAKKINEIANYFTSVFLEIATTEVPIAVIPPVVWVDDHGGAESLGEITPERIFDEVRNFIFDLAPIIFIILLIVGAIFYVISPIKVEYIKTGSEYLKWAVIGYFLLLVVSAIFSALKFIFGSP